MAGAFKTALGSAQGTTSSATLVITTTAAVAIGDLVVVRVATDNAGGTAPSFTCADSAGNPYVTQHQLVQGATAAAGVAGAVMVTKATAAIATGGTITVTLSAAVVAKAAFAVSFTGYNNTLTSVPVGNKNGSGTLADTSGAVAAGDLVLGWGAFESNASTPTADTDTLNGTWSALTAVVDAAGGTGSAHVQIVGQYKIVTAAGAQTWSSTGPAQDCCGGIVVISATPAGGGGGGTGDVSTPYGTFCRNPWGGMAMVLLRDRAGVLPDLNVTHDAVRATTVTGGDVGIGARFNDAPGQCQLEVQAIGAAGAALYDPLVGTVAAYAVWSTEVQVWVGIPDGLGPGTPAFNLVFVGAVTDYDYVPDPEAIAATLTVNAVDDLVALADLVTPDRAEESNAARLTWLAGLGDVFIGGTTLDAYTMGRTSAEAGVNVLEEIIATAHASRGAALMYPSYTSPTDVHMAFAAYRLADLGAPGSTPSWLFARDPGSSIGGGPWSGKVCLGSLDVKVSDGLLVNQARVRKTINRWRPLDYLSTAAITIVPSGGTANKNDVVLNNVTTEPGDVWHYHLEIPNYTATPANALTCRFYGIWTGMAFFDYAAQKVFTDQTAGATYDVTFPIGYPITLTARRQLYQNGATANVVLNGASTTNPIIEYAERAAGQGPEYLASDATSIAARGLHELQVGAMLALNADVAAFASWLVARNAVTIQKLDAVALNVGAGHADYDALTTYLALKLGDRVGVRYAATGTARDLDGWASRVTREMTPDAWNLAVDVVAYAP